MYKEQQRERRIRDKRRMKAKALRVAKGNAFYAGDTARIIKHADYMAVCSCTMCGNPRRWFGERTLQERKVMENTSKAGWPRDVTCKWN